MNISGEYGREMILYCDHCGKDLNGNGDLFFVDVDNEIDYIMGGLCEDCCREFTSFAREYLHKDKGYAKEVHDFFVKHKAELYEKLKTIKKSELEY